jgi:hypothetical protein
VIGINQSLIQNIEGEMLLTTRMVYQLNPTAITSQATKTGQLSLPLLNFALHCNDIPI